MQIYIKVAMRFTVLIVMFLSVSVWSQGQVVIGVDGGYAISSQYGSQLNLLPQGKSSFVGGVAIDYFRYSNFYLSSGLGYRAVGGRDTQNVPFTDKKGGRRADETFHLLHLNTVVRTAFRVGVAEFYLGFGPKVDFLMGKPNFKEELFSDYKVSRALFGVRYEVGLDFWFSQDRFRLGLCSVYEHDATAFAKAKGNSLYNQTGSAQLSFGYRLAKRDKVAPAQTD